MKKTIVFTMLIAFTATSFGQQVPASTPAPPQTDYLQKSKNQKTWAWILLGSGAALMIGGSIAHFNHVNNDPGDVPADFGVDAATGVATIGLFSAIGSIPLFIASSKNKKKANAASVFIDMEKAQVLQGTVFNNQTFPAVGVKIHL